MQLLSKIIGLFLAAALLLPAAMPVRAATQEQQNDSSRVMQSFEQQEKAAEQKKITAVNDKQKHRIMFLLGVPLLFILLTTAALGIAMGVYGKQVFVLHMVFAGLSISLAIVHVIVGLVWFYPF
jgi:hypothetical protein